MNDEPCVFFFLCHASLIQGFSESSRPLKVWAWYNMPAILWGGGGGVYIDIPVPSMWNGIRVAHSECGGVLQTQPHHIRTRACPATEPATSSAPIYTHNKRNLVKAGFAEFHSESSKKISILIP